MTLFHTRIFKLLLCSAVFILTFSCSKDADLLSDYVIADQNDLESIALLADDTYYITSGQSSMLLDVLNNDSFSANSQVTIIAASEPRNGSVNINDNNTLTYTPNTSTTEAPQAPVIEETPEEDSFEYTTEVTIGKGETFREQATVTITPSDMGELLAFPGAEGFGKYTTGGRGGRVIHVTNLNDSGPGSLREAIETDGRRTIVFDVGGKINLTTSLTIGSSKNTQNIAKENLTIAGETAPSPGITIEGAGIAIHNSNVIIRYITVRVNDGEQDTAGAEDAISIRNWGTNNYSQSNIIIDHCTLSHASDESFDIDGNSIVQSVSNVTFQNNMLGLSPNGYNILIGSHVYNYSIIGNYLHETPDRNPYIGYGIADESGEFINNLIYSNAGSLIVYGNHYDLIGNIFKGFNSNTFAYPTITYGANSYNNPNGIESDGALYVADNISINPPSNGFYSSDVTKYAKSSRVITSSLKTTWERGQSNIENRVFNYGTGVGNSLHREPFDQIHIDKYFNNTGSFKIPLAPSKSSTSRPESYDVDNDGMADAWERSIFGNLTKTASGDDNGDGYTNLETFLFSLVQ